MIILQALLSTTTTLQVYTSSGRHAAILACGWDDFSLPNLQSKPDGDTGASIEELTGKVQKSLI